MKQLILLVFALLISFAFPPQAQAIYSTPQSTTIEKESVQKSSIGFLKSTKKLFVTKKKKKKKKKEADQGKVLKSIYNWWIGSGIGALLSDVIAFTSFLLAFGGSEIAAIVFLFSGILSIILTVATVVLGIVWILKTLENN